jgi:hypothetical protein
MVSVRCASAGAVAKQSVAAAASTARRKPGIGSPCAIIGAEPPMPARRASSALYRTGRRKNSIGTSTARVTSVTNRETADDLGESARDLGGAEAFWTGVQIGECIADAAGVPGRDLFAIHRTDINRFVTLDRKPPFFVALKSSRSGKGLGWLGSGSAIAQREGLHHSTVNELLRLTLLEPAIIQSVLAGQQPRCMSLLWFQRNPLPLDWFAQRAVVAAFDA